MADPTIDQIISAMPSRFNAAAARDLDAVLQFRLSGDRARDFHCIISAGSCSIDEGLHPNPTLTMRMSAQTYVDMVMGRISGQQAFFRRKLRYEGPLSLAIRIHTFFTAPRTTENV